MKGELRIDRERRKRFGQFLRAHRRRLGLSVAEVASAIGMHRTNYSAIENGSAGLCHEQKLRLLAQTLRVELTVMLDAHHVFSWVVREAEEYLVKMPHAPARRI